MAQVEQSVDVDVPVRRAYDQWTQFEAFPRFMEGVEAVEQLDDRRLRWRATVGGKTREWDAEITDQTPTRASPGRARPAPRTPARSPSSPCPTRRRASASS